MPRFVLLRHECDDSLGNRSHWDFMLEREEGLLATWSLYKLPKAWQSSTENTQVNEKAAAGQRPAGESAQASPISETLGATQRHDHRIVYLDYEGPISGNRGFVTRIDQGTYESLNISEDKWRVKLNGDMVVGQVELARHLTVRWIMKVWSA